MKTCLSTGLVVLLLVGSLAPAQQGPILNEFQESLLSLEAETPPFRHFEGLTIQDFLAMRARGEALLDQALADAKAEAAALRALAEEWTKEADSLSEGLYLAPGVELDAEMMYRYSAWELGRFFEMWSVILTKMQEAETTSPASFWQFTEELDRANEAYDTARIYRLLANQQYVLERSEMFRSLE